MSKFLMLDIDGVLNGHEKLSNGYCTIDIKKMEMLNTIVERTSCLIVIISAWRYLILNGSMTMTGFRNMFAMFGASKQTLWAICDHLPEDIDPHDKHDRSKLTVKFLESHGLLNKENKIVVVDDGDFGYKEQGLTVVRPDATVGLTGYDVLTIIALLNSP
jgi:hypothetical protein